jgi:hypothetical protein
MLPILNRMFFLNKIWNRLIQNHVISSQLKLKLLSDQRTNVLSFSLNLHRQLSIRRFFLPQLVRLWLSKGSFFQLPFASLTAIFKPTRSYIIQFHHAPVHSFIHQSHLNTKSIMKYPQVTSCVQNRFKKQCKKFQNLIAYNPKD